MESTNKQTAIEHALWGKTDPELVIKSQRNKETKEKFQQKLKFPKYERHVCYELHTYHMQIIGKSNRV